MGDTMSKKPPIIHLKEHAIGPPVGKMGRLDVPRWRDDMLEILPFPYVSETPYYAAISRASRGDHVDIKPNDIEIAALGKVLRAHMQNAGTCVSQGWSRGAQFVALVDMVIRGQGEEWLARVHPGSIYAFSRVEVGGGRLSGDGSLGSWAAGAVTKYGLLHRIKYPGFDLTSDSDELFSVSWGAPGNGVPNALEQFAKKRLIENASLVRTGDEYKNCAYDYRPVPLCSDQGFTTVRDEYGICYPRGTWNHCMLSFGLLNVKHRDHPQGLLCAKIYQSWGDNNPTGPMDITLQDGSSYKLAPGSFLTPLEVLDSKILPQDDSFGMFGALGYVPPVNDEGETDVT